jgi:hypothetical protein
MKFKEWEEFRIAALDLTESEPWNTRYSYKIRASCLTIKVTNNKKTMIYKSEKLSAEINSIKQFAWSMSKILSNISEGKKKKRRA